METMNYSNHNAANKFIRKMIDGEKFKIVDLMQYCIETKSNPKIVAGIIIKDARVQDMKNSKRGKYSGFLINAESLYNGSLNEEVLKKITDAQIKARERMAEKSSKKVEEKTILWKKPKKHRRK